MWSCTAWTTVLKSLNDGKTAPEQKAAREVQAEAIGAFMFEMQELDTITEFDEKLWLTTIDTVTVHADGRMTFKFQGGKTLTSY